MHDELFGADGGLLFYKALSPSVLAIMLFTLPVYAGSITGTVYFIGKVPPPEKFTVIKNTTFCGTSTRTIELVRAKEGKLAGTVVTIENISGGFKHWKQSAISPQLKQKDCAFTPYLDVIRNGAELTIVNDDPVLHNIHAYEILGRARRTMFNLIQPPANEILSKEVIKVLRGRWMELECDTHSFMHGWRFLARNPYYFVTGDDGTFRIAGLPPGKYSVVAYHPTLGSRRSMADVKSERGTVDFAFSGD